MALILVIIMVAAIAVIIFYKRPAKLVSLPDGYRDLLTAHVAFYRALDDAARINFENKIQEFLGYIRIHGVNTDVDDLDRLLVASSGVIPVFGFPEWKYYNLRDVLLYPVSFKEIDFSTAGNGDVLGMVGDGAMQMMMILSKPSLRQGFDNTSGRGNTGIHEFVHLLDKQDGAVDGLPEALLDKQYTIPWLHLMAESIAQIKTGRSDINIYGATNKAEFLAVAAEYFFKQPALLRKKHPELYNLLTQIFRQHPV